MTLGFSTHWPSPTKRLPTHFLEKIMLPYAPDIREYYADLLPKIHTFRVGQRWRAGMTIQMVTGNRTPKRFQFNQGIPELETCISVQPAIVSILASGSIAIAIGEEVAVQRWLSLEELLLFAVNDGFNSLGELQRWFFPKGYTGADPVHVGQIVHWTDFQYQITPATAPEKTTAQ